MKTKAIGGAAVVLAAVALVAAAARADWDPGDGHKMHFPQLPDLNGWDVAAYGDTVLADDWTCTASGPVTDIHFWGSWKGDTVGTLSEIRLSIYADDQSKPDVLLWQRDLYPGEWAERFYGTGDQGWFDPGSGNYAQHDHTECYQYNVANIADPFFQEEGTTYWLGISVTAAHGNWGWKTADVSSYPDLITAESLDLAFVITGDGVPPPPVVPEPAGLALIGPAALALRRGSGRALGRKGRRR